MDRLAWFVVECLGVSCVVEWYMRFALSNRRMVRRYIGFTDGTPLVEVWGGKSYIANLELAKCSYQIASNMSLPKHGMR